MPHYYEREAHRDDTTRCPTCTAPVGEDGRWYPGEEMAHGYDAGRAEEEARGALQRAEVREARLDMDARRFSGAVDSLTSVVEATTEQTDRLLAKARASDAVAERLRQDLSDSTAQLILDDDVILSLRQEVARGLLERAVVDAALKCEALGHGWTQEVFAAMDELYDAAKALRKAEGGAGEPEDVCACFHDRRFHHSSGYRPYQCSVDGCDCLVFSEGVE